MHRTFQWLYKVSTHYVPREDSGTGPLYQLIRLIDLAQHFGRVSKDTSLLIDRHLGSSADK